MAQPRRRGARFYVSKTKQKIGCRRFIFRCRGCFIRCQTVCDGISTFESVAEVLEALVRRQTTVGWLDGCLRALCKALLVVPGRCPCLSRRMFHLGERMRKAQPCGCCLVNRGRRPEVGYSLTRKRCSRDTSVRGTKRNRLLTINVELNIITTLFEVLLAGWKRNTG